MTSQKFTTKLGKQRGSSTSADVAADVPVAVSPWLPRQFLQFNFLETQCWACSDLLASFEDKFLSWMFKRNSYSSPLKPPFQNFMTTKTAPLSPPRSHHLKLPIFNWSFTQRCCNSKSISQAKFVMDGTLLWETSILSGVVSENGAQLEKKDNNKKTKDVSSRNNQPRSLLKRFVILRVWKQIDHL